MSDSDSFISEVNEEVRRDRFYFLLRRYGWIAAVVVVLIVGGAAFSEYRKAQARAQAEGLGDAILTAMSRNDAAGRSAALSEIVAADPAARGVVDLLIAGEAVQAGDAGTAVATLENTAVNGEIPEIYRQIAAFKLLTLQAGEMDASARRQQLEAMAAPGAPLSLLAQEQLALMDVHEGNADAALDRLQRIVQDAGVSSDLQQRSIQVIVSLGGTPEVMNLLGQSN